MHILGVVKLQRPFFCCINWYKRNISGLRIYFFNNCIENKTFCDFLKRAASRQEIVISKVYPSLSNWSLRLEIMCMHFILSGPQYLLAYDFGNFWRLCSHYKNLKCDFPSMRVIWTFPKICPFWYRQLPLILAVKFDSLIVKTYFI